MRDEYVIERVELDEGITIKILPDDDAASPRECDDVSKMVCWHRRYDLGDKHDFKEPQDFRDWLDENDRESFIVMPLFLYDHSGIRMSTSDFLSFDPGGWDSGQVGYIYVKRDDALRTYGTTDGSPLTDEKIRADLRGQVEVYDRFISGGFTGFVIEDASGEVLDSCWNFDYFDYCLEEAKTSAATFVEKAREERAAEMEAERPDMYAPA